MRHRLKARADGGREKCIREPRTERFRQAAAQALRYGDQEGNALRMPNRSGTAALPSLLETAAFFFMQERNEQAVFDNLRADVASVMERDPASRIGISTSMTASMPGLRKPGCATSGRKQISATGMTGKYRWR